MAQGQIKAALNADDVAAVLALVEAANGTDAADPVSEQTLLRVRHGTADDAILVRYYLHWDQVDYARRLVGFGFTERTEGEPHSGELVVAPEHRRQGHGGRLLSAMLTETAEHGLRVWAHGRHPGAVALANAYRLTQMRGLWKMRVSLRDSGALPAPPLPEPQLKPEIRDSLEIRPFIVGQDESAWLTVNRRAFTDHPEQAGVTLDDLLEREAEGWFDPAGFFLAVDRDTGRLAGFHWTKVHADGGGLTDDEAVGEVYVVGVDPDWQGTGLGRALTLVGLRHLRDLGLSWVLLYTDEGNHAAVRLYESLGFTLWDVDLMYATENAQ